MMPKRIMEAGLVLVLMLGLALPALAVGSSSSSKKPAANSDYSLAVKAVKAKDFERALTLLGRVVAKDPGNADAWNWIGFSRRNLERYDSALAAYRKALAIKPEHRGAIEYLGELYLRTGDLDKAKAELKKLDRICIFGCTEYRQLKSMIERYISGKKSG